MNVKKIQRMLRKFAVERNWREFHNPKNLSMALSVEAGELMEIFQWLTPEESWAPDLIAARQEIADVVIYTLMLADKLGINIEEAVLEKIESNGKKYNPSSCYGSAAKPT